MDNRLDQPLAPAVERHEATVKRWAVPTVASAAHAIAFAARRRRTVIALQTWLDSLSSPDAVERVAAMNARLSDQAAAFYQAASALPCVHTGSVPPQLDADLARLQYELVQPHGETLRAAAAAAAVRQLASSSRAEQLAPVLSIADQSLLGGATAELHAFADFDLSIGVVAESCTLRIDLGRANPRVDAEASFAFTTLSGDDQRPLVLATARASVVAWPSLRALEQTLQPPRMCAVTLAELERAAAAVAARASFISDAAAAEERRVRRSLRIAIVVLAPLLLAFLPAYILAYVLVALRNHCVGAG